MYKRPGTITITKPAHRRLFPIGEHLMSLLFLASSELTEQQRERLTSHLAQRGIVIRNYILDLIFDSFKTLFTSTKTGIADALVRHGGLQRSSSRQDSVAPPLSLAHGMKMKATGL